MACLAKPAELILTSVSASAFCIRKSEEVRCPKIPGGQTVECFSKEMLIRHYCLTFTLQSRENSCKAKVTVDDARLGIRTSCVLRATSTKLDAQKNNSPGSEMHSFHPDGSE